MEQGPFLKVVLGRIVIVYYSGLDYVVCQLIITKLSVSTNIQGNDAKIGGVVNSNLNTSRGRNFTRHPKREQLHWG